MLDVLCAESENGEKSTCSERGEERTICVTCVCLCVFMHSDTLRGVA